MNRKLAHSKQIRTGLGHRAPIFVGCVAHPNQTAMPHVRNARSDYAKGRGAMATKPVRCGLCQRCIGKHTTHYATEAGPVLCGRCMSRCDTHLRVYPRCGSRWHHVQDHAVVFTNRSGAQWIMRHGGIVVTHPEAVEHKRLIRQRLLDVDTALRRIYAREALHLRRMFCRSECFE